MKPKSRMGNRRTIKKRDAKPTVDPRAIPGSPTTQRVRQRGVPLVELDRQIANRRKVLTGVLPASSEIPAATHGSKPCLKLGRQLVVEAFEALYAAQPDRGLASQTIHSSRSADAENVVLDFIELKRKAGAEMRQDFDDAFCMMRPTIIDGHLVTSAFIIGIRKSPGGLTRRRRNAPIISAAPIIDIPITPGTAEGTKGLRNTIARMWSWSDLATSTTDTEANDAVLVFRGEAARLLTPLDRTMFGQNRGKRLTSALKRLLRLKAELLDVAQTCQLRPEAVPSFLAGLPVNDEGDRIQLPVILLP